MGRAPESQRRSLLQPQFLDDLRYFVETDHKLAQRLLRIVDETLRAPFQGIGKPGPLKGRGWEGCWSRRLTDEHRIVCRVTPEVVDFLQARYHYRSRPDVHSGTGRVPNRFVGS